MSDYYDFSTSYADGAPPRRRKRRVAKEQLGSVEEGTEEWEDEEMAEDEQIGSDVEVVEEEDEDEYGSDYTDESLDDDDYPDRPTFDPETFELVLPSGRRIGHRSLMPYYKQRPSQPRETSLDLVPVEKRTIAGRTDQALIPARGGFGDFGAGQEVIKARNKGEAKNAMKHPYREMQKRERFKTQVGYIANSQKHWRDHLCEFPPLLPLLNRLLHLGLVLTHSFFSQCNKCAFLMGLRFGAAVSALPAFVFAVYDSLLALDSLAPSRPAPSLFFPLVALCATLYHDPRF